MSGMDFVCKSVQAARVSDQKNPKMWMWLPLVLLLIRVYMLSAAFHVDVQKILH